MIQQPINFPARTDQTDRKTQSICFFFNAQIHHLLHAMPLALELSHDPRFRVDIIAAGADHIALARDLAARHGGGRLNFIHLDNIWLRTLSHLSGHASPPKLATLLAARHRLARYDAIVVPERTSLLLRRLGLADSRFIHTCHGAGDRAVGYDPRIALFDFVLLAGEKQRRRMLAQGLIREDHYAIAGYGKFDLTQGQRPASPFTDNRPIILYNPHFSPRLSSWQAMGMDVLRQFAADDRFNLIVAPHVRLFDNRRKRAAAERMLTEFAGLPHIHVDLGSRASVDMSYVHLAAAYIGDVSSQIYEFIATPRPCLFLNGHRAQWREDPNYAHWHYGPVHESADRIPDKVAAAMAAHGMYDAAQRRGLSDTFTSGGAPASARAARAVADYLTRGAPAARPVPTPYKLREALRHG